MGVRNCKIFKNSLSYGDLLDGLLVSFSTQKEMLMSSGKRPGLKRRKVGILLYNGLCKHLYPFIRLKI